MKRWVLAGIATTTLVLAGAGLVLAQPPEIKSKLLQHESVSDAPGKEAYMLYVEFAPGATTGRHIHHGDEYATVVDGELQVNVEGQAPRLVKAGEAYHNAANVVHETKNVGSVPAHLITTFVVEKDKPLSDPVK
jgi:quercetin dioxygenase-like cupin family protein